MISIPAGVLSRQISLVRAGMQRDFYSCCMPLHNRCIKVGKNVVFWSKNAIPAKTTEARFLHLAGFW